MRNAPNKLTLRSHAYNRTAFPMPQDPEEAAQWGQLILELCRDGEVIRIGAGVITNAQLATGEAAGVDIGLALADGRGVHPARWWDQSFRNG
ncbi:MAG TPA: hypothetical protein VF456_00065 [Vicinamibacterales bacterium]